jgi:hypothetical protein
MEIPICPRRIGHNQHRSDEFESASMLRDAPDPSRRVGGHWGAAIHMAPSNSLSCLTFLSPSPSPSPHRRPTSAAGVGVGPESDGPSCQGRVEPAPACEFGSISPAAINPVSAGETCRFWAEGMRQAEAGRGRQRQARAEAEAGGGGSPAWGIPAFPVDSRPLSTSAWLRAHDAGWLAKNDVIRVVPLRVCPEGNDSILAWPFDDPHSDSAIPQSPLPRPHPHHRDLHAV